MNNTQHLKAYVQMHPDNKMAWYLLGKEYDKNGQQGKANYCYNQAGEVYEAFERSKVPAEMLREYEAGLLDTARQRHAGKLRKRRLRVAAMLLLLMFLPLADAPGLPAVPSLPESLLSFMADDPPAEPADTPLPAAGTTQPASPAPGPQFTALAADSAASGQVLTALIKQGAPSATVMLGMQRAGKWLLWQEHLPLVAAVVNNGNGRTVVQSYDKAACQCEVPEAEALQRQAAAWQEREEQLAVLWSAMRAYKGSKGTLPDSLKQLTAPFPGNILGGTTPGMKEAFARLRAAAESTGMEPAAGPSSVPAAQAFAVLPAQGQGQGGGTAAQVPFFNAPLTIVIDKQNHRLALTSGSVILRNYEVGLGGERTPEGTFVLTDKVVNPNGHDNGEFGSRGMQLSDTEYAIHGTNEEDSIGKDESLGCIRMKRVDVEELFDMAPKGTKVVIAKGGLPDELLLPDKRFPSQTAPGQTNPRKVYHWLN
ncbi:L,D-transpeptidase ['Paenibacillus yunnanensis' Narsing Rao et al. 2020]|uniref:L,D-transpeptidase n=1 Tax=Paenibacillus tengchongensis TaxID=2608684 RepID=UPI00124DC486|nr:L,D-transpeptidase [Paenibacillus tengchongensis]